MHFQHQELRTRPQLELLAVTQTHSHGSTHSQLLQEVRTPLQHFSEACQVQVQLRRKAHLHQRLLAKALQEHPTMHPQTLQTPSDHSSVPQELEQEVRSHSLKVSLLR